MKGSDSKSIHQAKRLYMKCTGKSSEEADYFVRIALRNDLPVLRGKEGSKFILGVTRMFLVGELCNARVINDLNNTLKLIASGHRKEYNRNLNGESAQALIHRFSGVVKEVGDRDREELSKEQFTENKEYTVVPINSFEEASRYSEYTTWCITRQEYTFNSYTGDGIKQFYFCLRDGYQDVSEVKGKNCPLDDYGLSMVAVSVDENGALHTCTCRWNHDNGGNDNIMDTKQISRLIGRNFYEVFKPNHKWEEMLATAKERLANGEDPKKVLHFCEIIDWGFAKVKLGVKCNFFNAKNGFLSEQWFEDSGYFSNGFAEVCVNGKWNYINDKGEYLSGQWFDSTTVFENGFGVVTLDNKENLINENGELFSEQWFEYCNKFHEDLATVKLNGKWNYINKKGKYLTGLGFECCNNFYGGFGSVRLNGKWNYINKKGEYLSDLWFDRCESFQDGFGHVFLGKKENYINENGDFLLNEWETYNYEDLKWRWFMDDATRIANNIRIRKSCIRFPL